MDSAKTAKRLNNGFITLALAIAFWPVLVWFAQRTLDKSDEPWGLVALVSAIAVLIVGQRQGSITQPNFRITAERAGYLAGCTTLCLYILTFSVAPNLVQAILLVMTLWFLVVSSYPSMSKSGTLGLLLLSLPLIPSLNFFVGYPIRVVVATGSCMMLNILGLSATVEGAMLAVRGQLIAIDAPCSGISMLWAEAYVSMLLACVFKLNFKKTTALATLSGLLIVAGNVLRTTTLVTFDNLTETKLLHKFAESEPTVHVGVGLIVFSIICGLTVLAASKLAKPGRASCSSEHSENSPIRAETAGDYRRSQPPVDSDFDSPDCQTRTKANSRSLTLHAEKHATASGRRAYPVLALCLVAAATPVFHQLTDGTSISKSASTQTTASAETNSPWPAQINGMKLLPVNSIEEENAFAHDFPGSMKRFTDGKNSYFIRAVQRETRQLHPSSDCFRGLGYQIEPHSIVVTPDGNRWGAFEAIKADAHFLVLERIYDKQGNSSTDVSQWYWLACLGKTHGPWLDVTIAQRL